MVLAADVVTIFGAAFGFALWIGLIYAVYRWGPFEEDTSIRALIRAATARADDGDRERPQ